MKAPAAAEGRLERSLGVAGATLLGLGAMLGTGVFVSIGLAAGAAGSALVPAILLAAALALCNALSSAQLAAHHPVSGGTYEYGHRLLNRRLGFAAGWVFLCAKSASAATAALGMVGYLAHVSGARPGGWLGPLAAVATLIMMLLVLGGLRRSARVNLIVVSVTMLALGVFTAAGFRHLATAGEGGGGTEAAAAITAAGPDGGFLYATALMFVAYTGYARIATLGEEVRDPARTIPRAIIVTLAVSAVLYVLVALAALGALSPAALAASAREDAVPLEAAARAMELPWVSRLLALGAVTAMLGVLLNLVLGLSRVVLAMARRRELPPALARVDAQGTPRAAVVVVGVVVAAVAMLGRVEVTWAFSALTVLIYYAITHLAALRLDGEHRRYPPAIAWIGLAGCLGLAAFVPAGVWGIGLTLGAAGLAWQALARRLWAAERQT